MRNKQSKQPVEGTTRLRSRDTLPSIHISIVSISSRSLSQVSKRLNHAASCYLSLFHRTSATTTPSTSSPTKASRSRAAPIQLTSIQTLCRVSLISGEDTRSCGKSQGHQSLGKHLVYADKALTRSVLFFIRLLVSLCRPSEGTTYRFDASSFFYSCTLAVGKNSSVSHTFCHAIAETC